MYKITSPLCKSWSFIPIDMCIANQPYMPTCRNNHLHKESLGKGSSSRIHDGLQIITRIPRYLQIIPNALTEITLKEEMHSIFMNMQRAQNTGCLISDSPMPSLKQVPCVKSVFENQPSKDFSCHATTRFPDPVVSLRHSNCE
jgi:hypothetical protein